MPSVYNLRMIDRNKYARTYYKKNKKRIRAYQKSWRLKNIESERARARTWIRNDRAKNPIKHRAYDTKRHKKDRAKRLRYMREYFQKHKPLFALRNRASRLKCRLRVIGHYGGQCVCCHEKRTEFLCIDHKNGDGARHRRDLHRDGKVWIYNWLEKKGYPKDFQILCWNCNSAKHIYGICPHQIQNS